MADNDVQRGYLPPVNPRTHITQADRPAVFAAVRKQLDDILNGPGSYFPDGAQITAPAARLERLRELMQSIDAMRQNSVSDPDGVLEGITDGLDRLRKAVSASIDSQDKAIVLNQDAAPGTRDRNELYVSPYPDPYAPNPLKAENRARDASFQTLTPDRSSHPSRNDIRDVKPALPARMGQPALPMESLTTRVLQLKGVPDADIDIAINDPARMNEFLKQLYHRPSMAASGERRRLNERPNGKTGLRAAAPRIDSWRNPTTGVFLLPYGRHS
jgi:hypothetical protein